MNESGVYNDSDLVPFRTRVTNIRNITKGGKDATAKLLERQLHECGTDCHLQLIQRSLTLYIETIITSLEESLSVLSPELIPIHEKLVHIRRQLVALAAKEPVEGTSHKAELKPIQEELRKIDS